MKNLLVFLASLMLLLTGCGQKVAEKYVGQFNDIDDPKTGYFSVYARGHCIVTESIKSMTKESSRSDYYDRKSVSGDCHVEGDKLFFTFTEDTPPPDFGYSEFRGKSIVMSIVGDSLLSPTGRRFKNALSNSSSSDGNPTHTTSNTKSDSSNATLTTEKAQVAVDKWANRIKASGCSEKACEAKVRNIRDVPAENIAIVTIAFTDFVHFRGDRDKNQYIYNGDGTATFEKYTDGTWAMTKLNMVRDQYLWYDMRYEAR